MENNPLFDKDILESKLKNILLDLDIYEKMVEDKEFAIKHSDKYDYHYVNAICKVSNIDTIHNSRDINDKIYDNWIDFICEVLDIPKKEESGVKTYPLKNFRYKSFLSIDFISKRVYLEFNSELKEEYKHLNKLEKEKDIPILRGLYDYYDSLKYSAFKKYFFITKNILFNRKVCEENLRKLNEHRKSRNESRKNTIIYSKKRIKELEEMKVEWEEKVKVLSKYGYKIVYN